MERASVPSDAQFTEPTLQFAYSRKDSRFRKAQAASASFNGMKGAMVLYRVRWKGYDSEGDTWEPEAHLDDCREVLLDFKYKQAEMKQKAAKKEIPKLVLSDVFEADSDSEPPSVKKDASPHKKKKKEEEAEETKIQEDLKKKKAKSGKSKERTKSESEPPESQSAEAKPKKRTSEGKEGLSSKKQRREDSKDSKKSKKEELKDTKVKGKEEHKEKKHKKEKPLEPEQPPAEQSEKGEVSQESVSESKSVEPASEEKGKTGQETNERSREASPEQPRELQPIEEDSDDAKMKRKKKKKHKKLKTEKGDDVKSAPTEEIPFDKKASQKKQKHLEKVKEQPPVEKAPAPVQKNSRQSVEEKIRKLVSMDSSVEVGAKEPKSTGFAFSILPGDVDEIMETSRKEKAIFDHRLPDEPKSKDLKPAFKERRNTRDETDPWSFTASEGDQEVMDPVCHLQENSCIKSQVVGLGMDLQLEWMTLEDFQRHLEGNDEILPTETITSSALKEAVKNGDYLTVKFALNSTENYNLDQEDSSGMTLVMMAAAAGQDDLLRLLIKKGAKINARQKNGTTALIHAAEKDHLSTVALLLEAGAYVNLQQNHGETALFKACRRGNYDIVRLLIEHGADCNVQSKHNNNALQLANGTNVILYELIKNHLETLTRVVEDAIRDYFETRLALLEPVFPIACHRLCEGPDFSLDFHYKPPPKVPEGSGILLFVFHANFFGKEVVVRLCGPCSVQAVVLNDKFQLPIFLDAHFIYSFNPINGPNKLFIRLSEVPTAKVMTPLMLYYALHYQLQI
uniref:Chromo domain-containing protein n=1 Tax=Leptobrachium leishanense TaxID=445787 RepID=A0A8C5M104_9ANUR